MAQSNCRTNFSAYLFYLTYGILATVAVLMSFILSSRYYLKNTPNSLEYLATNNDNYQLIIFCYMAVRVFSDCLPYKLLEHGEVLYRVRCSLVTILTGFVSVWVTWSVIFKKKSIQDLYSISKFRFVIGFGVLLSFDLAITLPQFIDSKVHQFVYFFLFFVAVLPLSLMKLGHLGMQRLMYKTSNFTLDELSVYISNLIANMKTATIGTNDNLLLRGIMRHHFNSCLDASCFCKKSLLYDRKANRLVEFDKRYPL